MKSGARIGLAVGLGYILGRRRKLRSALTLAAAVAVGRASRDPGGLLKHGGDLVPSSPQLTNLSRLSGPLAAAGKAAASAAAGSGVDALSGKLRGSADALRRKSAAGRPENDGGPGQRSAPDEEQELDDQPAPDDEQDQGGGADRIQRSDAPRGQRRGR